MSLILHTANLGIGKTDLSVLEEFAALVSAKNPDILVLSGNITAGGREKEFEAARDFIASLEIPVFCVCGSSDISALHSPQRLLNPYGLYRRFLSPMLDTVYEDDAVFMVGLSTARPFVPHIKQSNGMVLQEQISFLYNQFQKAPHHKVRICVLAHPLVAKRKESALIWGSEDLLRALEEEQVDFILSPCMPLHQNHGDAIEEQRPIMLGASGSLAIKGQLAASVAYNSLQISSAETVCEIIAGGQLLQRARLERARMADDELIS